MSNGPKTRINKYLSEVGYCSRRAADKLIAQRRVTINGRVPEVGTKVGPEDRVEVDGQPVAETSEARVYIAFNKPIGIVCTTDTRVEPNNIIDYIGYPTRIFPIGRLDKPSQGLIFLTNDGDIVNKILRARHGHEKEYVVTVDRRITKAFLEKMRAGIPILGTVTNPCTVERVDAQRFRIILTQGLNRQIRRMCEFLGYQVTKLKRIRIMNVRLDLPVGKWRHLTAEELAEIHRSFEVGDSTEGPKARHQLILFHKPYGVLSQFTSQDGAPTLAEYVDTPGVYAAGRLDKDSEGLLVLTDDGELQHEISAPKHRVRKTYWAQVEGVPTKEAVEALRKGVELKDGMTKRAEVRIIDPPDLPDRDPPIRVRRSIPTTWLELTLTEGRNRQVRRMTAAVGFPTLRLIRYAVGDWTLDGLGPGESTASIAEVTDPKGHGQ